MDIKVNFDFNIILKFFKRSRMLFIPILICLGAFLLLIPTILVGKNVKSKAEASRKVGDDITRMLGSDKSYSRQQVQVSAGYADRYQQDVDALLSLATETTQRELISYNIFPRPETSSTQVYTNFGKLYRLSIESMTDKLGGRDAPSLMEKNKATAHLGASAIRNDMEGGPAIRQNRISGGGNNNAAFDNVLDALCKKRAAEIPVYANISLFRWYDFWGDYTFAHEDEALKDCWDSQVAFWIYQDVVDTIVKVNSGSSRVSDSVVKRLLDVNFSGLRPLMSNSTSSRSMGDGMDLAGPSGAKRYGSKAVKDSPVYITDAGESPFSMYNWTGRICDDKIDVVQFGMSVIVETARIPVFMKELLSEKTHNFREGYSASGQRSVFKHNQITLLSYTSKPVDRDDPVHADYRYGDRAVTSLEIVCEYIFHKDGYVEIMPEVVKKSLESGPKSKY